MFIFIGYDCYPVITLRDIFHLWTKYQLIFHFSVLDCFSFSSFNEFLIYETAHFSWGGNVFKHNLVSSIVLVIFIHIFLNQPWKAIFPFVIYRFRLGNIFKVITGVSGTELSTQNYQLQLFFLYSNEKNGSHRWPLVGTKRVFPWGQDFPAITKPFDWSNFSVSK